MIMPARGDIELGIIRLGQFGPQPRYPRDFCSLAKQDLLRLAIQDDLIWRMRSLSAYRASAAIQLAVLSFLNDDAE
jgi:hypothetical protein